MSRHHHLMAQITLSAPRASGDEPSSNEATHNAMVCSPRERG